MPKEVICIHLGQAGCQVGSQLWELFCLEHGILPDGTRPGDDSVGVADEPHNAFFGETASGQHVPRCIFLDTDPSSREDILNGTYGNLFHPDTVLGYKQDCGNNFFEGRTIANQFHVKEDLMDRVRLAVDLCSNLQGFFVFHAFGGGTGTGVGVDVLEALHDQFERKVIFQPVIYPSNDFASSIVEPYNCIFATAFSLDTVHLSLMLDNQAAYKMCHTNLKISTPSFIHLNRIIAQMVSACTTSLRYESELNASLGEIVTNLIPERPYRYAILSLSPVRHPARAKHESFSTKEIITDLFEDRNILCDCAGHLKANRYLAAAILLRGIDKNATEEGGGDDAKSQRSAASGGSASGMKFPPIQVNDAASAIDGLMNPRGGHRKPLKFLPWLESGGFKVGVVGVPPYIPEGFMAESDRQGALLGNSTAVRQLFVRQYTKFLKLFYHKAYVWQFLEKHGELDLFYEAQEKVRDLINLYEVLLNKCVEVEGDGNPSLALVGKTSMAA